MKFHTNLPVSDLKTSVSFYSQLLGAPPVKEKPDYAKFLPPDSELNIAFHQGDPSAQAGQWHLGFEMPNQEALDLIHQRLQALGLVSRRRESSVCCYAAQDKFWVVDPDGYEWEIYVLLEDTSEKMSEESGCCGGAQEANSPPCC